MATQEIALPQTAQMPAVQLSAQAEHFQMMQRTARIFAMSGLFGDVKGKTEEEALATAFAKIAIGEGMGFTPAQSMMGIDVIQGRPAVSAQLRASRMQQLGYDWTIDWYDDKNGDCIGCRLWLMFQGRPYLVQKRHPDGSLMRADDGTVLTEQVSVGYLKADADKNNLLGKDNWKKNPRNMYFARAVSNLQRWYVPKAIATNVLSIEEAQDEPIDVPRQQSDPYPALSRADFDKKHGARINEAAKENRQLEAQRNGGEPPPEQPDDDQGQDQPEEGQQLVNASVSTSEKAKQAGFAGFGRKKQEYSG